ncbi:MAG: hypothetical protein ACXACY_19050 [Candidatus Hodarchaeales archaeon]|jgi:hypothetical protein
MMIYRSPKSGVFFIEYFFQPHIEPEKPVFLRDLDSESLNNLVRFLYSGYVNPPILDVTVEQMYVIKCQISYLWDKWSRVDRKMFSTMAKGEIERLSKYEIEPGVFLHEEKHCKGIYPLDF